MKTEGKLSEFDLIERYFRRPSEGSDTVITGIGDDAAVIRIPDHHEVVISSNTLSDVFSPDTAYDLGQRLLEPCVSRLQGLEIKALWATLALTLPDADENWLKAFSHGLMDALHKHHIILAGGDTTRGPLTITLQVYGAVATDGSK